jgi:phosphate-selective porin OprO/OprP
VLTGEEATFRGVAPRQPVGRGGRGPGAWQLVVRATGLAVDTAAFPRFADPTRSVRDVLTLGAIVNWYANQAVRFSVDYHHTELARGRPAEQVWILRTQLRM